MQSRRRAFGGTGAAMRTTLLISFCLLAGGAFAAQPRPQIAPGERFRLADLLPRGLQKNPRLDLSVITELTEDGKTLPAPTKAQPAYYAVLDGGLVEAGDVLAGEKPPAGEKLARLMQSALAESGFLP